MQERQGTPFYDLRKANDDERSMNRQTVVTVFSLLTTLLLRYGLAAAEAKGFGDPSLSSGTLNVVLANKNGIVAARPIAEGVAGTARLFSVVHYAGR